MFNLRVLDIIAILLFVAVVVITLITGQYDFLILSFGVLLLLLESRHAYLMFMVPIVLSLLQLISFNIITIVFMVILAKRTYDMTFIRRSISDSNKISFIRLSHEMLNYYAVLFIIFACFSLVLDFIAYGSDFTQIFSLGYVANSLGSSAIWTAIIMVTYLYAESSYLLALGIILKCVSILYGLALINIGFSYMSFVVMIAPLLCLVMCVLVWNKFLR